MLYFSWLKIPLELSNCSLHSVLRIYLALYYITVFSVVRVRKFKWSSITPSFSRYVYLVTLLSMILFLWHCRISLLRTGYATLRCRSRLKWLNSGSSNFVRGNRYPLLVLKNLVFTIGKKNACLYDKVVSLILFSCKRFITRQKTHLLYCCSFTKDVLPRRLGEIIIWVYKFI